MIVDRQRDDDNDTRAVATDKLLRECSRDAFFNSTRREKEIEKRFDFSTHSRIAHWHRNISLKAEETESQTVDD